MLATRRAGLGATSGAVDCSSFFTWPPNIFNPECYGATYYKLFGNADQKAAAYGLTSPDTVYAPIQAPPTVKPPQNLTTPPASGQDASQTVSDVLAQQWNAWVEQNAATMDQTAANIQAAGQNQPAAGLSWWVIGALAALGLGGLVLVTR